MSKLEITAIVLCTVCFFVPESRTESFRSLDKNTVDRYINYAMFYITQRAGELRHELSLIQMLPFGKNAETVDRFKSQMENDIAMARVFVDDIIENASENGTSSSFNETECRSYFIDYEAAAQDVMSHLNVSIMSAINKTFTEIEEAIAVATAATEKLEDLKTEANSCHGYGCYVTIKTSQLTMADVLRKTQPALCSNRRLANGSKVNKHVRLESRYIDYDKKSNDLIKKTLECVNSSH